MSRDLCLNCPSLVESLYRPETDSGYFCRLKFYWEEIHPFHPLLPPAKHLSFMVKQIKSTSPLLLAIRCILALIPGPNDPAPKSVAARALRRNAASNLAKQASDRIDQTIASSRENNLTPPIDCVQALSMLGLYEFGQTGNAAKNMTRMTQAVELAMEMGLHHVDQGNPFSGETILPDPNVFKAMEGEDVLNDMRRRTWWVIYGTMLISTLIVAKVSAIASQTGLVDEIASMLMFPTTRSQPAVLPARDRRITTNYPACSLADDVNLSSVISNDHTTDGLFSSHRLGKPGSRASAFAWTRSTSTFHSTMVYRIQTALAVHTPKSTEMTTISLTRSRRRQLDKGEDSTRRWSIPIVPF